MAMIGISFGGVETEALISGFQGYGFTGQSRILAVF